MKKAATTIQSLASALSHEATDKRIDILRQVGDSGSISQAARDAKVSYKAAWQAIDTLTNLAGVELVTRAVGGSGGGGASITPAGQKLLAVATLLNETRNQVFASFQSNELLLPRALPVLSSMGVRTSMRNQFPCQVVKLEVKGSVARVYLSLPNNDFLVSRITKASAELLDLKKGQAVLALCKATAVVVMPVGSQVQPSAEMSRTHAARQCLSGHAVRVSRSAAGDEVSMQLDTGLQIVGFAGAGSGVKRGTHMNAWVDESAVVIALSA